MAPEHRRAYVEQSIDLLRASVSPHRKREPIDDHHPLSKSSVTRRAQKVIDDANADLKNGDKAWEDMKNKLLPEHVPRNELRQGIECCFKSLTLRLRARLLCATGSSAGGASWEVMLAYCKDLHDFLQDVYEQIFDEFLLLLFPHTLHSTWKPPCPQFKSDIIRDLDDIFNCCLIYTDTEKWGKGGQEDPEMEKWTEMIIHKAHRLHSLLWQLLSWFVEGADDTLWYFQERGHDTSTYFRVQAFRQGFHRPCDAIAYDLTGLHLSKTPQPSIIAWLMIKHEDRMEFKDDRFSSCLIRLCVPELSSKEIKWVKTNWKEELGERSEDFECYWRSQGVMIGIIFRRLLSGSMVVSGEVAQFRESCFLRLLNYVLSKLRKHPDMSLAFLASVARYVEAHPKRIEFLDHNRVNWSKVEKHCGLLLAGTEVDIPTQPYTWEGRMIRSQFDHYTGDVETDYHDSDRRHDPDYRHDVLLDMKLYLQESYYRSKASRR